jgi:hypothetical protein
MARYLSSESNRRQLEVVRTWKLYGAWCRLRASDEARGGCCVSCAAHWCELCSDPRRSYPPRSGSWGLLLLEPGSNFIRIKAHRPGNPKRRNASGRRHLVNVLWSDTEQLRNLAYFERPSSTFQCLDESHRNTPFLANEGIGTPITSNTHPGSSRCLTFGPQHAPSYIKLLKEREKQYGVMQKNTESSLLFRS